MNKNISEHESQTVDHDCPKVVGVGIFAQIYVIVNEYGIMNNVILDDNRSGLHDAPSNKEFNSRQR
jgi:hypothetical protein